MYGQMLCMAMAALGVDFGWQSLPDGGLQYLIQIRPSAVQALEAGRPIESDIPSQIQGQIRSYKITVGSTTLPQYPSLDSLGNSNSNSNSPSVMPNPMRSRGGPTGYSSPGRSIVPGPPAWPSMSTPPTVPSNSSPPATPPGGSRGVTLTEKPSFFPETSSGSSTSDAGSGTATGESKSLPSPAAADRRWSWGRIWSLRWWLWPAR